MRTIWVPCSLFLLCVALCPAAAASGFKLKSLIAIDAAARSAVTADFNHDGNADVAVASYDANSTISVFLGRGDGSLQPVKRYSVGSGPYGVAAGDVNADGNPDLVVGNYNDGTVSVLLGNGDGTFQQQIVAPATNFIMGVALGDFNDDGKLDVVTASEGAAVLLGNGDGTFQPPLMTTSLYVLSVVVGDYNGDGKLDLSVGYTYGSGNKGYVQALIGTGNGSFVPGTSYALGVSDPFTIASADLNHDGKLDLTATTFDPGVDVLLGNGDGTFSSPVFYPMTCTSYGITIADFDRDGNPDLAAGDFCVPSLVSVFTGNGNGTFQPALEYSAEGNSAVAVVAPDLNNDGSPDLVVASNGASSPLAVLINTGGTLMRTTSSANPSKVGQKVTFTTQVKQSVPGTGTPSGTVKYKDGTKVLGTANLVNGKASFSTSSLMQGTHRILGSYSGDANFNPNSAKPLMQVVNP